MVRASVLVALLVACTNNGNSNDHALTISVTGSGRVTSAPSGISCPQQCEASFGDNTTLTLTATPDAGETFMGWTGGSCSGAGPTCTIVVDGDLSIAAMFSGGDEQALTVTVTGNGTVTSTPDGISCPGGACEANYPSGTVVALVAAPGSGDTFQGWAGACSGIGGCTVTLDQAQNVTATFSGTTTHLVSLTIDGFGSVQSTPSGIDCANGSGACSASFPDGMQVTLDAMTVGGGTFTGWSGPCSGNSTSCTFTVTSDQAVTATFGSSGYVLTVQLGGDGAGNVTSSPAGIDCSAGSTAGCSYDFGPASGNITLTATPASGSSYAGQGTMGNIGCNGQGYALSCSYGLNQSGVTVDAYFSAWGAHYNFPATITGLALAGTTYVAVGAGGNAATSTNDATGGHGAYWTGHPASDPMNALATSGNVFYAPRTGGYVASSADGVTWTDHAAGAADLFGIAAGGGTIVAVGAGGAIEYSTDGATWTAATSGVAEELLAITYANAQFVAVGYGGTIVTSPDGIAWTSRTSGVTNVLYALAYGLGGYIAVGSAGVVVTSADAITWTAPTTTGLPTQALRGVMASSTLYVAAGDAMNGAGHAAVYTSSDGTHWSAYDSAMWGEPVLGVSYPGDGDYYLLGSSGSIARSSDGSTWSMLLAPGGRSAPMGQGDDWGTIAYNGSIYVAGGAFGAIFTSADGITWTSRRASTCCDTIDGIQWGAGLAAPVFAAVGTANNTSIILTSPDGITWTQAYPTSGTQLGYLTNIAYGGSTTGFAAVGWYYTGSVYEGIAITSADGATWTASATASTQITSSISSLTYGNGVFVASGVVTGIPSQGAIYTSPDGAAWTQQPPLPSNPQTLATLGYGNGTFVVFDGDSPAVFTSTNATTWTRTAINFQPGAAVAYGNGMFVNSALYTSTNGTTWTQQSPLPDVPEINAGAFLSVIYANGAWIATSTAESILIHP